MAPTASSLPSTCDVQREVLFVHYLRRRRRRQPWWSEGISDDDDDDDLGYRDPILRTNGMVTYCADIKDTFFDDGVIDDEEGGQRRDDHQSDLVASDTAGSSSLAQSAVSQTGRLFASVLI